MPDPSARLRRILLQLVLRGSNDLVSGLCRRLAMDREGRRKGVSGAEDVPSWRELTDMALAEGVLTAEEGRWVQAMAARPGLRPS
jgi:hypothetical protein